MSLQKHIEALIWGLLLQGLHPATIDVTTAFLQSRPIGRDVYLKPPSAAGEKEGKVWNLNVTVYGLADAQRECHQTVSTFLKTIGGMTLVRDHAVFLWYTKSELFGFLATHVDDFLWAGHVFSRNTWWRD